MWKSILNALLELEDYSDLPKYKQTFSIAITQQKVTKSISTRRLSDQIISLLKLLNNYAPNGYNITLVKK